MYELRDVYDKFIKEITYKEMVQGIPFVLADGWNCRIKEDKIL